MQPDPTGRVATLFDPPLHACRRSSSTSSLPARFVSWLSLLLQDRFCTLPPSAPPPGGGVTASGFILQPPLAAAETGGDPDWSKTRPSPRAAGCTSAPLQPPPPLRSSVYELHTGRVTRGHYRPFWGGSSINWLLLSDEEQLLFSQRKLHHQGAAQVTTGGGGCRGRGGWGWIQFRSCPPPLVHLLTRPELLELQS